MIWLFAVVAPFAAIRAAQAETVVLAGESVHYMGNLSTYAAALSGAFKAHGVEIKMVTMRGGPAAANALISNDIEILTASAEQAIKMRSKGQDVKIIASLSQKSGNAVLVPKGSTARSLRELKGGAIGVTATGSSTDVATRGLIVADGMDPDTDFKVVGLGSQPAILAAFQRGQIQAATISAPAMYTMLEGGARIVEDLRTEPNQELCVVVRAADLAGPKAAELQSIVSALAETDRRLTSDDAFAADMARKSFPEIDGAKVEKMVLDAVHTFHSIPADASISHDSIEHALATLERLKALDRPVSYEELVDTRFLRIGP